MAGRSDRRIWCDACAHMYDPVDNDESIGGQCLGCFVPDIHAPSWAGYRRTMTDVLVAAPDDVADLIMVRS